MSTKEKILQTALDLFNNGNTQMATTNHIAKAMGISPGNLHYHYKNREEIIRALYKQMRGKMTLPESLLPKSLAELRNHQEDLLEIFWEYRFFYKELLFLFSRDEALEKMYVEDNLKHRERILITVKSFIKNKEIKNVDENFAEHITDVALMSVQFYLSYLRTLGKEINKDSIKESLKFIDDSLKHFQMNLG